MQRERTAQPKKPQNPLEFLAGCRDGRYVWRLAVQTQKRFYEDGRTAFVAAKRLALPMGLHSA
jgi:hypothetical protein